MKVTVGVLLIDGDSVYHDHVTRGVLSSFKRKAGVFASKILPKEIMPSSIMKIVRRGKCSYSHGGTDSISVCYRRP